MREISAINQLRPKKYITAKIFVLKKIKIKLDRHAFIFRNVGKNENP